MVRVSISPAAFAAIVATLPGNVNVENQRAHFANRSQSIESSIGGSGG
jgi:hypothetical protein